MKKHFKVMYVIIVLGLFAIILQQISRTGFITANWVIIVNNYISSIPYLFLIGLGLYWLLYYRVRDRTFVGDIFICGLEGIFFAGLFKFLYDNNIWINQYIVAPQTIEGLMFITIILWVCIGFIFGFGRNA